MFAVINLGMKSIRLCLLDGDGRIKYKKAHPLNSVIFGDGVEQDGEEWWRLVKVLFREAETAGYKLASLRGITVSASASCLVCVDESGVPLRPIIMVSDRRHHSVVADSCAPIMLQRIEWLRASEPENFAASAYFLSPNDYIIYRLCGTAVTDTLNAEKSGYNVSLKAYDVQEPDVLRRLPRVADVGEVVAEVKADVASELRLSGKVPVALSSYDAIVSVVGSGVAEDGVLCDVSGTVTSIRMETRVAPTRCTKAVATQAMPALGCYYVGGSNNLGGGLVEWLKTTFYPSSPHDYDMIQADAQSVAPRDSRILFLPYLLGERAPIWNPDAKGVFFGVERMHSRKHFARATLEAVAFSGRNIIDEIVASHGRAPTKIRLSGGLSRLEICNRIKADVYGVPLEIISEFESTVVGAYLLAFHRQLGMQPGTAGWLEKTVKVRDIVLPDEEAVEIYRESFAMFKELYESMKPLFVKHSRRLTSPMKSEDGYLENL